MAFGGCGVFVWVKRKVGLAHNLDKNGWLKTVFFGGTNDLDNGVVVLGSL
jgi:hypothetical protein